MLQIAASRQFCENSLKQSILTIISRFQTLYASITNQLNRVVKNHSPVQNNTNVTTFLQNISTILLSGESALNTHISDYATGLDQFDLYNALLSNSSQYLFDNVRGTLKPNLMSCFPLSNGYFISAVFQSFTLVQNCYLLYFDTTSLKMSAAINLQMASFEANINIFNSQFWSCVSTLITDDAAVSCVNNLVIFVLFFLIKFHLYNLILFGLTKIFILDCQCYLFFNIHE